MFAFKFKSATKVVAMVACLSGIAVAGNFSLTISPIHLLIGVVEVTGEYSLDDAISISAIGGMGSVEVEDSFGQKQSIDIMEYGLQGRFYFTGTAPQGGWHLGAESLWIDAKAEDGLQVEGTANGLMVGPFIGHKSVWDSGITFDAQLGYGFLALEGKTEDTQTGETSEGSASGSDVILNLNLGYSF